MQHKPIIATFLVLFSLSFVSNGQKLVNTPFSRFNLGSLEPVASFRSLGMGGIGVALRGNNAIFFSNPASYSSIDTNSFVFDIGVDYSINQLSDSATRYSSDDMNFSHLIIGFPLAKGLGIAFGVVPYSSGYYKLSESVKEGDAGYDPVVGAYTSIHNGDGGLNNFFIGTGFKIKKFSAGINMSLLFGQLRRSYQVSFTDYANANHNNSTERLQVNGINFDYGLQYSTLLKKDYFLNLGLSYRAGKNYNSNYEQFSYTYSSYNTRDTISYISDNTSPTYVPGTLRVGISAGKTNKLTTGIDYVATRWSKSKIPGSSGYAADTRLLMVGVEYIPDKFSNYSLLKRIEYRIGGHIGDNYLIVKGQQVKEVGASFGVGLPMRRPISRTNLYFNYTKRAGSSGNLIPVENYYTVGLSLNLYDFWFVKRKYE